MGDGDRVGGPCFPPGAAGELGEPRRGLVAPQQDAARVGGDGLGNGVQRDVGDERPGNAAGFACGLLTLDRGEQMADRGQRRRLAAGRGADQRLPQDQRLGPAGRDLHRRAGAAETGRGAQHGLRHIIRRCAGRTRRVSHPITPRLRQDVQGKRRDGCAPVFEDTGIELGPAPIREGMARGELRSDGKAPFPGVAAGGLVVCRMGRGHVPILLMKPAYSKPNIAPIRQAQNEVGQRKDGRVYDSARPHPA